MGAISLLLAIGFTLIHLSSKYMKFLHFIPRSRLLSIAGGISVAYVFIHLLPELNRHQQNVRDTEQQAGGFLENHVYLFAMAGLTIFYGLERMVKVSKGRNPDEQGEAGVFWIHIMSFAVYNALIGYLLLRGESKDLTDMLLYFFALSVHFISNDHGLRQMHKETYDRYGRWLLSLSILMGWAIGWTTEINEKTIAMLFAVLSGGVILNVLKEELPEERESNFLAFLFGLILYTCILLYI